jgi:hypothetical protein
VAQANAVKRDAAKALTAYQDFLANLEGCPSERVRAGAGEGGVCEAAVNGNADQPNGDRPFGPLAHPTV